MFLHAIEELADQPAGLRCPVAVDAILALAFEVPVRCVGYVRADKRVVQEERLVLSSRPYTHCRILRYESVPPSDKDARLEGRAIHHSMQATPSHRVRLTSQKRGLTEAFPLKHRQWSTYQGRGKPYALVEQHSQKLFLIHATARNGMLLTARHTIGF